MKTLIIGASGTIGRAIVKELERDTDIISANHTQGDYTLNLADPNSIKNLFEQVGAIDAIICAASRGVVLKALPEMKIEDYITSFQQKLFGQITVALEGMKVLNDKGSITLTTGILNQDYIKDGSAASAVNNAVEGFVKATALDMPRGIRINVISPALLEESAAAYADYCPGYETVSSEKVARAYRRSIYGIQTGQIFRPS